VISFKIATFNANSIRVRLNQIIEWVGREKPDVLCVQETKVQDKDFPTLSIEKTGYHVVYAGQKSHAGVAVLTKQAPARVQAGFDDGSDKTRLLSLHYNNIYIINTYVPQGRNIEFEQYQYKLAWFKRLQNLLDTHYNPEDAILWTGDFNVAPEDIDVYSPQTLRTNPDFHPDAQAALEHVREWGFIDIFRKHHPNEEQQYTYWDYRMRNALARGAGWRIDHIWGTSTIARHSSSAWIDVEARKHERPSDHTFLVAEFCIPQE
jgi:exodeoxyribonuclease-3